MNAHFIKLNKYYFICILSGLMTLVSCEKSWLEERSDKALVVPSTLGDLQGLMDNAFSMNTRYPNRAEVASDGHYVKDAVFQNYSSLLIKDAYIWAKTSPQTKVTDWDETYKRILVDNTVLESLENINPANENERRQVKDIRGQALFNRARQFFELAQIFAPAYDPQTAKQDLSIVLKVKSDLSIPSTRSTVNETYEQILKDLNEAKELLPERPLFLTRGSSSSAYALLARVYLSMRDYENAYLAADNCLKLYSELLDFNDIPSTATTMGRYNKEVLLHTSIQVTSFTSTDAFVDQSLFDLYHIDDLRKTRFYKLSNGNITFKGTYDRTFYTLFNGLATDEVYLIRAECHARAGRTDEALKDLNDLLVKRWNKNVVYPTITAGSAQEALNIILIERKKELVFRSIRWTDLRRLNKEPAFATTVKRVINGVEYKLEPNSYNYTFPIPDDIVRQTGMPQNAGWPAP